MDFSGTGDKVVGPFDLQDGIVTLIAQHSGSSNFIVKFIGERDELSINTIGIYGGARAHPVSSDSFLGLIPGPHLLEVTADGSWDIQLRQEFPSAGAAPPLEKDGTGDEVLTWLALNAGTYIVSASHRGSSNFIVYLSSSDGSDSELLVNEIGQYGGQKVVKVGGGILDLPPGYYAIVVEADGDWSISIE